MPLSTEKTWTTAAGYPAVIIFDDDINGFRRGYVGIPKDHSLYGVWIDMDYIGGKPESLFNVHGKITYIGNRHGGQMIVGPEHANDLVPTDPEYWWLGFWCGYHELDDGRAQAYLDKLKPSERTKFDGKQLRSLDYAVQLCEVLASQVKQKDQQSSQQDRDTIRSRVKVYMNNITDLVKFSRPK